MKTDNHNIPELIVRYLTDSASFHEKQTLLAWINEDPANEAEFFEIKVLHDNLSVNKFNHNTVKGWNKVLEKRRKNTLNRTLRRIAGYAAVAAIFALSAIFIQDRFNSRLSPVVRYVSGNGISAGMFELSDKSKVYVGSLTTFSCDEDFGRRSRRVHLDGEAYFEVTGDPDKPFIVQAKGQDIEVLGTKFNVAAYSQDSVVVTTLLEGSVKLRFKDIGRSFTLAPNQQYVYNHLSGTGTLKRINASSVISWIDGYYVFRDERLGSIIHQLENMYAIKVDMSMSNYMDRNFTGTIYRGQSVSEILDIISVAIPIRYTIQDETVTILDRK